MMEEICMQCGDEGFTNAFVHCIRCLNFVVHRYCLEVIPETRDEFVRWFCDDCEELRKKVGAPIHGSHLPPETKHIKTEAKKNDAAIAKQCVNKYSVEGVYNDLDEECVVRNKLPKQSHYEFPKSDAGKSNKGTKQKFQRCISLELCDLDTCRSMAECPPALRNGSFKGSKKKRMATATSTSAIVQEWLHKIVSSQSLRENEVLMNIGKNHSCIGNKEPKDRGERTMHCESNSNEVCEIDSSTSPAEPVVLPVWRGSFNIQSKKHDVLKGFVAHASPRACQKVYEVASKFGPELCLEKFPRSEVWPKSFKSSGTCRDSIALFFFPTKISEHGFDQLVNKMTLKDLALKASLQNAELLIFTSTELPLRYWMFEGKHYLWAVFKWKQR